MQVGAYLLKALVDRGDVGLHHRTGADEIRRHVDRLVEPEEGVGQDEPLPHLRVLLEEPGINGVSQAAVVWKHVVEHEGHQARPEADEAAAGADVVLVRDHVGCHQLEALDRVGQVNDRRQAELVRDLREAVAHEVRDADVRLDRLHVFLDVRLQLPQPGEHTLPSTELDALVEILQSPWRGFVEVLDLRLQL